LLEVKKGQTREGAEVFGGAVSNSTCNTYPETGTEEVKSDILNFPRPLCSPLVQGWEAAIRDSHNFNARPPAERKEDGAWVYEGNSGDFILVAMPDAKRNAATQAFSEIVAGDPPMIAGYRAVFAMHDHPFALVGSRAAARGFLVMVFPQPSTNDIEYAKGHNIPGMVVSHAGNFYFGFGR
jgi:hypothetical protein